MKDVNRKIRIKFLIAIAVMVCAITAFSPVGPVNVQAKTTTDKCVVRTGYEYQVTAPLKGKVTWAVDNKKVVKIEKRNNNVCTFKLLKNGKATLSAKSKKGTCKYKLTVRSGDAFVEAWCKQWVKNTIKKGMNFKDKLILASAYVVSPNFHYGNTSKAEDVITSGVGTCVSGGKLVAAMCKAMGYKAKIRFAAKDDMSRYPAGVIFMNQHYNVEVTVNGKKYYIDGTPGSIGVYLSTKKKPLFWGFALKDHVATSEEFLNTPAEELF